jgi:hypothetical protein
VPTLSADVEYVAIPSPSDPVASSIFPSKNDTLPVGVRPVAVTFAVNVTVVPKGAGLGDEVRTVVVDTGVTVTLTAADVDAESVPDPEYVAVNE